MNETNVVMKLRNRIKFYKKFLKEKGLVKEYVEYKREKTTIPQTPSI